MANAGMNMSASLGITSSEPRELKIGASFSNQGPLYHTLRYDFKPASVDAHKVATVEVNEKNAKEVMVTVPHTDGAGTPHTVFKGNQCPIKRDCVLIINKATGEMTLEKLHTSITVKKTRFESATKLAPPLVDPLSLGRKPSPKHHENRGKASPKPSSLGCIPKHSPLHASPNPSLPMIGEDIDPGYDDLRPTSQASSRGFSDVLKHDKDSIFDSAAKACVQNAKSYPVSTRRERDANNKSAKSGQPPKKPPSVKANDQEISYDSGKSAGKGSKQSSPEITFSFEPKEPTVTEDSKKPYVDDLSLLATNEMDSLVGILSDSSSDSGSESGSSESSSDAETPQAKATQGHLNGSSFPPSAQILLSDDLQLSDSGSDLD